MLPSSTVELYRRYGVDALSSALGVVPGTATTMVKALAESGLVEYEPYAGVALTPAKPSGAHPWHLVKIAYEKHFLYKMKTGSSEPIYEKHVLMLLGIERLERSRTAADNLDRNRP